MGGLKKKILGDEKKSQLQPVIFSSGEESIGALKKSQLNDFDEMLSYRLLRKKRMKKAFARMLVWLLVVTFIPVFVFFATIVVNPKVGHNFFGYTFCVVASESMKPVFDVNDCIIVKNTNNVNQIKIGSDITFIRTSDGETVTHRVIDIIENENGDVFYVTKGVHNPTADGGMVSFDNVVGVRVRTVGWLGHMVMFFRTPYGLLTFLLSFAGIMLLINFCFKMSDDLRAISK